jgi:hypothetical protein
VKIKVGAHQYISAARIVDAYKTDKIINRLPQKIQTGVFDGFGFVVCGQFHGFKKLWKIEPFHEFHFVLLMILFV